MPRPRALLAWSSGKDSAWALHELRRGGEVDVVGLLTTVVVVSNVAVTFLGMSVESLMAYGATEPDAKIERVGRRGGDRGFGSHGERRRAYQSRGHAGKHGFPVGAL